MSSMFDMLNDVADFQEEVLENLPESRPTLVSSKYCIGQTVLLAEEVAEFSEAAEAGNIVGVADALADVVYVALGTAYRMGLPFAEIWDAVHSANMRKIFGMNKRGVEIDAVKPKDWVGPEAAIARAINRKNNNV